MLKDSWFIGWYWYVFMWWLGWRVGVLRKVWVWRLLVVMVVFLPDHMLSKYLACRKIWEVSALVLDCSGLWKVLKIVFM